MQLLTTSCVVKVGIQPFQHGRRSSSLIERSANPPSVQSDNYNIYNCGSQVADLVIVLKTMTNMLVPVIADVKSSVKSKAYNVFFGDASNAPIIAAVFENISTGAAVIPQGNRFKLPLEHPTITCATDPREDPRKNPDKITHHRLQTAFRAAAYRYCNSDLNPSAGQLGDTTMVTICDNFFNDNAGLLPSRCLPQNPKTNAYTTDGDEFQFTQVCLYICNPRPHLSLLWLISQISLYIVLPFTIKKE